MTRATPPTRKEGAVIQRTAFMHLTDPTHVHIPEWIIITIAMLMVMMSRWCPCILVLVACDEVESRKVQLEFFSFPDPPPLMYWWPWPTPTSYVGSSNLTIHVPEFDFPEPHHRPDWGNRIYSMDKFYRTCRTTGKHEFLQTWTALVSRAM